jgi:spectinomycin phosphotransferase
VPSVREVTNPGVRDRDDERVRGRDLDPQDGPHDHPRDDPQDERRHERVRHPGEAQELDPVVDPERARTQVRTAFGLEVGSLQTVTVRGGRRSWRAVAGADAYRVRWTRTTSVGSQVALVLARTFPERPAHVLPAPAVLAPPLRTTGGATAAELDGGRLTVEPWLDGPTGRQVPLTPPQWTAFGRLLARVHALDPSFVPGLPRTTFDPLAALAAVERAEAAVSAALGALPDVVACAAAEAWVGARHRIALVRARAVHVGARLAAHGRDVPVVVCHADAHLGHVVATGPRDVALVDWERAALAPPEQDLMVVLGGVLADAPVTAEQAAAFFTGYGRVDIDADRLAYVLCVRALLDVAQAACTALDSLAGLDERARALTALVAALSPTGIVDAALG